MQFKNEEHKKFFENHADIFKDDPQRLVLFYLLGISDTTRTNIAQIYDFKTNCVIPDCLTAGWLTKSSGALIRLAFDLFHSNPVLPTEDYPVSEYSVSNTLGRLNEWLPYALEAIKYIYN